MAQHSVARTMPYERDALHSATNEPRPAVLDSPSSLLFFFFLMIRPPPSSPLFPSTPLFLPRRTLFDEDDAFGRARLLRFFRRDAPPRLAHQWAGAPPAGGHRRASRQGDHEKRISLRSA